MSGLPEFLLARIAEDEEVARAATAGPWRFTGKDREATVLDAEARPVLDAGGEFGGDLWLDAYDEDLAHIARHDPARVLAECGAQRRIVEIESGAYVMRDDLSPEQTPLSTERWGSPDYVIVRFAGDNVEEFTPGEFCERFMQPAPPSKVLRLLALPYADHPDYREEWKP